VISTANCQTPPKNLHQHRAALVSTKGVFPISPKHLDTVGPMARDIPHLVQGMDLWQRGFASE
jgi:hypothetical protein